MIGPKEYTHMVTPQQERLKQAEHHEELAAVWFGAARAHRSPKGSPSRRLASYYRRTARQNRRAHERNSH